MDVAIGSNGTEREERDAIGAGGTGREERDPSLALARHANVDNPVIGSAAHMIGV